MAANPVLTTSYPTILRYTQNSRNGIRVLSLKRYCIGYIIRGTKHIYYGDERHTVKQGCLFYFKPGTHYVEEVPEGTQSFEQVVFFFTTDLLSRTLGQLSQSYGFKIPEGRECPPCTDGSDISCSSWPALKTFFTAVNSGLREGLFGDQTPGAEIKFTKLIYLLLSQPDCILKINGSADLLSC